MALGWSQPHIREDTSLLRSIKTIAGKSLGALHCKSLPPDVQHACMSSATTTTGGMGAGGGAGRSLASWAWGSLGL